MDKALIEKREDAWDAYSQQPIEFTISSAFNAGYLAGAASVQSQSSKRGSASEKISRKEVEWVAVEDGLPEDGQQVLCLSQGGRTVVNSWEAGCDQNEQWFVNRFTAWMPIPPYAPKEKTNE